MEDEGVDGTVMYCRQNQLGQMADFPPLYLLKLLTYKNFMFPQIKYQTIWLR